MGRNHRRKRKYKFNQRERAAKARANVALRAYQPWRLLDVRDVTPVGWVGAGVCVVIDPNFENRWSIKNDGSTFEKQR